MRTRASNKAATTIVDALRKERSKKYTAQINGADALAKRAAAMGETAKIVRSTDPNTVEEVQMGSLYYSMLATYHQKTSFSTYTPSKKSSQFWRRVVECRKQAGVTDEVFLKSQFEYFHKNFGCAPTLPALTTAKAVERAQGGTPVSASNTVSSGIEYKADRAQILSYFDKLLRDTGKAHGLTKEQVYTKLVIPGTLHIAKIYLDVCPIYRKISST